MRRALGILGGIGLALGLSQFPEYNQQYIQRLGGAVDELAAITAEFDAAATRAGITRTEALGRYAAVGDDFIAERGDDMSDIFARHQRLSAHLDALRGAGPVDRLASFGRYYDPELAERTLGDFRPAVPATGEGLAYAGAGLAAGYALVAGLISLVLLPFRRRGRARERIEPI